MPTSNFYIAENSGWVEIANAPTEVRVSGYPHTHPYYLFSGSAAPSLVPASATGTITFGGLPVADETVTIGSEVYTFKAAAAGPFEVTIGADAAATATNLVAKITASSAIVNASNLSGVVTVTAKIPGTVGNYALSEAATNVTVSGAALTGGADVVEGILVCHYPFQTTNKMTDRLYARIVNPVPNARVPNGKLRLDVFTIA